MIELQQLGLARQLAAKTMLELIQDPVLVVVVHDMSYHAMLEELLQVKLIGLQFSASVFLPFLFAGTTFASRQSSGMTPVR